MCVVLVWKRICSIHVHWLPVITRWCTVDRPAYPFILCADYDCKARFPLPELTARVDWWLVSITRQHGPCWRARVSTSRVDGPSTRVMETGHPSTRVVETGLKYEMHTHVMICLTRHFPSVWDTLILNTAPLYQFVKHCQKGWNSRENETNQGTDKQ